MYKFTSDFDYSLFVGQSIDEISFTKGTVLLIFQTIKLQLSGSFGLKINNQQTDFDEIFPIESDFQLLKILDKKIVSYSVSNDLDKLELIFSDNIILTLNNNPKYECFDIYHNSNRYII